MYRHSEGEVRTGDARRDAGPIAFETRKLTLSPSELAELTGYRRVSDQLRELLAHGFFRARVRAGVVILERAHYDAVCGGAKVAPEPKVRLLVRRS